MTVSTANTGFSYAQAAKAKPIVSKPIAVAPSEQEEQKSVHTASYDAAPSLPELVTGNWAEDVETEVDEQAQVGAKVEDKSHSLSVETVLDGAAGPEPLSSSSAALHTSRSSSTTKGDENPSPVSANSDALSWRRKSSNKGDTFNERRGSGSQRQKGWEVSEVERSPSPALVEAPPPMVNIWTQRAQEAKSKQVPISVQQTKPNGTDPRGPAAHTNVVHVATSSTGQAAKSQTTSGLQEPKSLPSVRPSRASSSSQAVRTRDNLRGPSEELPRKASGPTPSTSRPSQFPSLQDSVSWPKPETTQDEDRKRSQSKLSESQESEKPAIATGKPHGKNEWKTFNFTPTVKFETPIPPRSGRGPRSGGRGGREGVTRGGPALGHLGARTGSSSTGESTREPSSRDRSASGMNRASSVPRSARHDTSEDAPASFKRTSLPNDVQVPPDERPKSFNVPQKRGSHPFTDQAANAAALPIVPSMDVDASSMGANALEASKGGGGRFADGRTRRRSSRAGEHEHTNTNGRNGDRKRSGSLKSDLRSNWIERRAEAASRSGDQAKDANTALPFRERGEGRPERGRGGRSRGGIQHGPPPASLQITNSHSYFPSASPSAKSATFHGPYLNNGPHTRGGRGGANGGPRPASLSTDAIYGRYAMSYPGSAYFTPQQYGSPSSYDNGSMSPSSGGGSVNTYMNLMLANGVAAQLQYYFSLDNLCKDMFLRSHMDSQGFVSLRLIAGFQRMRNLTLDFDFIKYIAQLDGELEVFHSGNNDLLVRRRREWQSFVLDMPQRDASARHEGPALPHYHTSPVQVNGLDAGHNFQAIPSTQIGGVADFQPVPTGTPINGYSSSAEDRKSIPAVDTQAHLAPRSRSHTPRPPEIGVGQVEDDEPDSYPDEKINTDLTVLTRPRSDLVQPPSVSRSFSNGTIDNGFPLPNGDGDDSASHPSAPANGLESRYEDPRPANGTHSI